MKLNRLLALFVLLSGAFAAPAQIPSIFTNPIVGLVPARLPSIIYIQCHGLGYGDLSCYGQASYQTPNLDRLAAEGVRFTNFRPGSTNFTDALNALVTGRKNAGPGALTVASRLQALGYSTGLIGEWTVDNQPWARGFDQFGGFLDEELARDYFAPRLWRFDAHNSYDPATNEWVAWQPGSGPHNAGQELLYENTAGKQNQYLPELLVNMTCNFIRMNQPDKFSNFRPFFLLVDFPAPRSAVAGADKFPVPSDAPFSDQNWPQAAKNRAALILRLDGSIGRLLDHIQQENISNNVAIFFSSSAAPEKFADARMNFLSVNGDAKTTGALPMIVHWPETIPAGQVSNFKWTGMDFVPTALEISGTKPPKDLDGISILPVLEGKKGPETDIEAPGKDGKSF